MLDGAANLLTALVVAFVVVALMGLVADFMRNDRKRR